MCLLIYLVCSLILLSHGGQCELTWDKVYGLLSAKLDKIILEQDVMKKEMKDIVTSVTAMNQQGISFEKRLSELATFSQQLVVVQERLDNIDSHAKDVATAEVGRRTHLLRRGLELEKAAAQSRSEKTQVQILKLGQEFEGSMNNTRDLSARVDILNNKHDIIKSEMKQTSEKTGAQIANVKQDVVATQRNTQTLQSRVDTFERTQSDLQSKTRTIETQVDTARRLIGTVQQEVATTQRNTQTLQSRVDTFERTQSDLQSTTRTIESQVHTTRGQISRLQYVTGSFVGFSTELGTPNTYYYQTVIKFDKVKFNKGDHYSPSTGIFTVPVSGVYVFMFNVEVDNDPSDKTRRAYVVLCVNDIEKGRATATGLVDYMNAGNAVVLDVKADDRVYMRTGLEWSYIYAYRTTFSGALLHVN